MNAEPKSLAAMGLAGGVWIGPAIVYALLIFASPMDILTQSRMLSAFCSYSECLLQWLVPSADFYRHAANTSFSEIARIATSFMIYWWSASVFGTLLFFLPAIKNRNHRWGSPESAPTPLILVAPIFTLLFFWSFYCLPGDWSVVQGASTNSRLGYFLLSSFGILTTSILMGYWPILLATSLANTIKGCK